MNGPTYISANEPVLLPFLEKKFDRDVTCYYVQDNAPCHKSAFSMKWFKKNKINLLDWPAVSPDFNVIENLWDIIDNKLNDYRLNNVNDLQQAILEIWTKISNETCENLVRSMPRCIKKMRLGKRKYFSKILTRFSEKRCIKHFSVLIILAKTNHVFFCSMFFKESKYI
ncbi:unnamed protein product [Rotaria magnacalcarata]|uniref:Tc1-like transposase DDE domain-containing protein n=1 Tax=Rotaria magnacalcarata TaxID=392030 RepID=A0A816ZTT5_9BILA|nr:unnamed protein product [Rotaria magnacalcarata]